MSKRGASMVFAGCLAMTLIVVLASQALPARAQGWWPWSTDEAPVRRPPPVRRDAPPDWDSSITQPGRPSDPRLYGERNNVCLQLEQRLVDDQRRGSQTRDVLPRIEADLRQADRNVRAGEANLERSDCYEYFLFSKTLRRSRRCFDMARQVDDARRTFAELDSQRRQMLGSNGPSYRDDLIRELARNNCGAQYTQEARKRGANTPFSSLWQDEDTGPTGRGNQFGTLPFATYRTVCVRLCDGYYFPISFSTLQNHFSRDMEACQSKCAAPVALYYHQNPGGSMEQAQSAIEHQPYTSLKTAFRYRKEYVQGCSCKQSEYTPSPADRGDRKADAAPPQKTRQAQRP